jgi:threonine/homoserine/homoserine lactone efflux protein
MLPGAFAALTAVVAVAALTPGPAVTAIVARAMSDGLRPAMAINAGVVTGDLIFFALAAAGMSAMARSAGTAFEVLKYAGAAYLAWQGLQFWRAKPRAAAAAATAHAPGFSRNYGAGLLLMAGHAQAMLFYAALLPGFVNLSAITIGDFVLIALMIVLVIGGINAAYGLAAAHARRFMAGARAQRTMNRVAGSLLLLAAALVVTRV